MIILIFISFYLSNSSCCQSENYNNNKNIYILHIGDVITNEKGDIIDLNNELKNKNYTYVLDTYKPLLKSADMNPYHWYRIGMDINRIYNNYDAFIIIHGADTIKYTGAILSYMFDHIKKPIILIESNNIDKKLFHALDYSKQSDIPEIVRYEDGKIIRNISSIPIAELKNNELEVYKNAFPIDKSITNFTPFNPQLNVVLIKIFPTVDPQYIYNIAKHSSIHALVLEIYDFGESPQNIIDVITDLNKKGLIIISISENKNNSNILEQFNVIDCRNMKPEAALTKLYYVLSITEDRKVMKELLQSNLRGEL